MTAKRFALTNYQDERGAVHIRHHGGDAFTELMELELGYEVAFALFHLDDIWLDMTLGVS